MEPIHNYHPPVCCWNCDHFQRYDPSPRPKKCDGECRQRAIPGALFITDFMPDPTDRDGKEFGHNKEIAYYWAHITCGLRMRCHHFEPTTEEDLPQSPLSFNCQHEAPTSVGEWEPWIKPGKGSCFTCAWFEPALCQRAHKEQLDNGGCLHDPPRPRQFHHFEPMLPRAELGATPTISGARSLWCSKWEGPRPEIGYTSADPNPVKSNDDVYVRWEAGRERLTWLSSIQITRVKAMQAQMAARKRAAESRIVKLDNITPIK